MAKKKKMCKWSKDDIRNDFKEFTKRVAAPTHACGKCGRVADDKKSLCKPIEL